MKWERSKYKEPIEIYEEYKTEGFDVNDFTITGTL